jgi:hypothetical protein
MLYGPANPNYLYKEPNMFVKFKTLEQTKIVEMNIKSRTVYYQVASTLTGSNYRFSVPALNSADRAAYRAIGDLITRLKTVDSKLKALGAVPGRGGLPELSESSFRRRTLTLTSVFSDCCTEKVRMDPLTMQARVARLALHSHQGRQAQAPGRPRAPRGRAHRHPAQARHVRPGPVPGRD